MKTFKEKIVSIAKKKRYSIPAVAVLIIALFAINAAGKDESSLETRTAVRTTVAQEVSVTGTVKSAQAVDMAFEKGGKLASIDVEVGDRVAEGAVLAHLSNGDLSAQLSSSLASLDREKIKLGQLQKGLRSEEIDVSNASLGSAKTTLTNARLALIDQINSAFSKADDAVENHADTLFENPDSSPSFGVRVGSGGTTYNIDTPNYGLKSSINSERREVGKILDTWSLLPQSAEGNLLASSAVKAEADLVKIQTLLNDIANAVNPLSSTDSTANAVYEGYKTDISTARTNVNTALTSLRSAIQSYNSAESALTVAERESTLKQAPATADEIAIQLSAINAAQAQVNAARAELAKTIITAPVDGVITAVVPEVGEIVGANAPAISIIAADNLQIEAYVPEADMTKIRQGASADVTFDAYGSDFVAPATVLSVDPAATDIDGIPTYRTILGFTMQDERIKSGLTANVEIKGESRENVVAVPSRAIKTEGTGHSVRVLEGKDVVERPVETGLRGSDGMVEIESGLSEGDIIVTSSED